MSYTLHSSRKIYRKVLGIDEVINEIEKYIKLKPKGSEVIPVEYAIGRVLAEDIYAQYNYPPFDRSLYDGYAVIADDICTAYEDNPVKLKLRGRIMAGQPLSIEINRKECCEVATGAPIPYPADTIVPVEYTKEVNNEVLIYRRFNKGFGVQYAATDCIKGSIIARKGTLITPLLVGVLAAVGVSRVKVYTRPKVAIISIGDELIELGRELPPWKIFDSNSLMIKSFLASYGIQASILGIVEDNYNKLKKVLDYAISHYDLIITIGGTSAGLEDLTYKVLGKYKPGIIIHGLKIKPGSPTIIALAGNKVIIGMPGFPFSCYIILYLVVERIIRKLLGLEERKAVEKSVILMKDVEGKVGYVRVLPALIKEINGKFYAYPFHLHSGFLSKVSLCDGFILTPENVELIKKGSQIKAYLTNYKKADIIFIGSHCPLFETIISLLAEYGIKFKYMFTGSLGGILAIKDNFADIAGTHIYNPETNKYNIDILKRLGIKNAVLIRGYIREQGFIMKKDLANKVKCFLDIVNLKLKFINRNKGSGTRALIDYLIEKEAKEAGLSFEVLIEKIRGYNVEVNTHETIALAIKQGKADIGVGVKYVAEKYGLAFYKLKDEYYDFVVNIDFFKSNKFSTFIKLFKDEIQRIIKQYKGYKLPEDFGEVIYKP